MTKLILKLVVDGSLLLIGAVGVDGLLVARSKAFELIDGVVED